MSLPRLELTKDWTKPTDFPTIETSEAQVRADLQLQPNEIKEGINKVAAALEATTAGSGASQIGVQLISGVSGSNVQAVLQSLATGASGAATTIDGLIESVTYDSATGVLTFTKHSEETITIDTDMEKIVTNFSYNSETESLVLTYPDGRTVSIPMSSFISEYDFQNTDSVSFTVNNHKVTANITSSYVALLRELCQDAASAAAAAAGDASRASGYANTASGYKDSAGNYAKSAESYAKGGTSSRTGEDSDNAKYYSEQASSSASTARSAATTATTKASDAAAEVTNAKSYAVGGTGTRTGENTDNAKYYCEQAGAIVDQAGIMRTSIYDPTNVKKAVAFKDDIVKASTLYALLPSSGWVDNAQTVYNSFFVSSGFDYIVSYRTSSRQAYLESGIYAADTAQSGALTFYCDSVPSTDVSCVIMKVASND